MTNMIQIYYFVVLHVFFFLIGYPLVGLLPKTWKWRVPCLSGIIGLALVSFLSTVLYVNNISIQIIFYLSIIYICISFAYLLYKKRHGFCGGISKYLKSEKTLIISWVICGLLLIIPRIVGGDRFGAYQGNHQDNFNYWVSSIVFAQDDYERVKNYSEEDLNAAPIKYQARKQIRVRPSIDLMYALTTRFMPRQMPKLNYVYLIFFMSLSFGALSFLIINLFRSNKLVAVSIALVFVVGFYGQYVIDINAWSQIGSTPAAIALLAITILSVLKFSRNNLVILGVLFISLLYIYPILYTFYIPAYFLIILISRFYKLIDNRQTISILFVIIISILSGMLYFDGVFICFTRNFNVITDQEHSMWTYFQKYLFGQGDVGVQLKMAVESDILKGANPWEKSAIIVKVNWVDYLKGFISNSGNVRMILLLTGNVFMGMMGLYFLTPVANISNGVAFFQVVLTSLLCVIILCGSFIVIYRQIKLKNRPMNLMLAFLFVAVVQICILLSMHKFWEAAKGHTYISPFILVLVCSAIVFRTRHHFIRLLTYSFIIVQICFALFRIYGSANATGIHYKSPPYPSVQSDAVNAKTNYDWNFDHIIDNAESCRLVGVDVTDKWIRKYIFSFLFNRKIDAIYEYKSSNVDGAITQQNKKGYPDCIIKEEALDDRKKLIIQKLK